MVILWTASIPLNASSVGEYQNSSIYVQRTPSLESSNSCLIFAPSFVGMLSADTLIGHYDVAIQSGGGNCLERSV